MVKCGKGSTKIREASITTIADGGRLGERVPYAPRNLPSNLAYSGRNGAQENLRPRTWI
jgi:hypothetical protein